MMPKEAVAKAPMAMYIAAFCMTVLLKKIDTRLKRKVI